MTRRWGFGPVFYWEWCLASRRWQLYAARSLFVALLLAALALVYWSLPDDPRRSPRQILADAGANFFYAVAGTQLALVLLAAPAATAGSICLDKARGGLLHLLVTDLSDAEIVLGKLAARLLPVLGMVFAGMPVLFLALLLGGISPEALLGAIWITLGVAVLGCALALTLSVWGRRTHEVLLATYMAWCLALLGNPLWRVLDSFFTLGPPPVWLEALNPFWLTFAPYSSPGLTGPSTALLFLGVALALAGALVVLAVTRVRAVAVRQAGRPARRPVVSLVGVAPLFRRPRWWPGPSLDRNPVLWRERRRRRTTGWMRFVWGLYVAGAVGFSVFAVALHLTPSAPSELAAFVNGIQVSVGLLLLSAAAASSLAEERARGGLDVLLASPLSTASIVWGKWCGAFRAVPRLAVLPVLVAAVLAQRNGAWRGVLLLAVLIVAYGAAVASFGLAAAVWVRRPGRAVAVSVSVYVLVAVGWLFAMLAMIRGSDEFVRGLASASPFFGVGWLTAVLEHKRAPSQVGYYVYGWVGGWAAFYLAAAWLLFLAVLFSFDRHLGRVRGRFGPRVPRRSEEPSVGNPDAQRVSAS
jgi:ABC-type transport system involved in multi-copper enzyme maturation permease subunit